MILCKGLPRKDNTLCTGHLRILGVKRRVWGADVPSEDVLEIE